MPEFFDITVELDPETMKRRCFSWNAVNMMNGLMYGNGGLKLWSKEFAINMQSHEFADDDNAVDFCWEEDYKQVHKTYSEVWNNGSAYQAFRVGFREGVKLALDRGERVLPEKMKTQLHNVNLRNLRIWSSVGADIDNGLWAMYGTRYGWHHMCAFPDWDYTVIRDFDWFNNAWKDQEKLFITGCTKEETEKRLLAVIDKLGAEIKAMTKIAVPMLNADQSEFFRDTFKLRND